MTSINCSAFFDASHDNDLGNYNSSVFSTAWSQQTTPIKKSAFITNDSNIVILPANANKTVAILHSFKNIGGTPVRPMNKYACFMGASVNATVVAINMASITGDLNIRSPSIKSILACNSVAEIAALPVPPNNATIRSQKCTSFLPAPWLLSAILSSGLNNPLDLIV
jgi:hypothetical protein